MIMSLFVDMNSSYETFSHCNILSKHHHDHVQIPSCDDMFDLCRSEMHTYINDICIKFPSRVTVSHSIPAQSSSIKKH